MLGMSLKAKHTSFRSHTLNFSGTSVWKQPRRAYSSQSSLDALHEDILFLIAQHLNWPEDLYNLVLVCHRLNDLCTPVLYRTISITPCPRTTLALLAKLDHDEELSACVHELVFDFIVRSLRPRIPHPDDFEGARKKDLTDLTSSHETRSGDPHRVRLRLHTVLPKLKNLHIVHVKQWNHTLQGPLSPAECYHYWSPNGSDKKPLVQRLRLTRSFQGPPAVMYGDRQPCPLDIITLLLLRCNRIQKLSVTGTFPGFRFSHPPNAFSKLTVLVIGERSGSEQIWNDVLRHCKLLRVLGLLNVHFRFENLVAGCYFPHLESIEWYGYAFSSLSMRRPMKAFAEFMRRHSSTLKCVALAPRAHQPRGFPFDGGEQFLNPDNGFLPVLETLRLQNWQVFASEEYLWPSIASQRTRKLAEDICRFVAERPSLVDLAVTDFPADLVTHLTSHVLEDRRMRRLLIGDCLHRSKSALVPASGANAVRQSWSVPGSLIRRRQAEWTSTRKQEYLREVWMAYDVMFSGLELEECGYRPWLLSAKCPRSWVDYLRR